MGTFSIKEKYFKFILYLAVIILLNIAGITLFLRADLTHDKLYSLSSASRDTVATLSEPLTIKVFFSKDLPAPHNNTERYLKDLLKEYSAMGGKYFNYTFYNVTPKEETLAHKADENRKMAQNYGIQPVQIRIMEDDEVKFKKAYMGLVIIHGDLIEKIKTITSTDGIEYRLTTAINKLNNKISALLRVDEKVKVNMYLSSSLNKIAPLIGLDNLSELGGKVAKSIENLNDKSLNILEFKHIDAADKKDIDELGQKHDLMALSWPAVPEENIAAGHGAAGLVIEFKNQTASFPLINITELPIIGTTYQMADLDTLEEKINSIVEKLIGINKDIGFLADHGTHSLMPDRMAMMQGRPSQAMQVFNSLVSSRYSVKPVRLKDEPIPEGLNCLIIARPTQKFSEYELFQIDQALMKGTNIAFISDSFQQIMPEQRGMPPRFEPIDTGLEKLLNHYGIKIKKAYVLDKESYKQQTGQSMGGGQQNIYFAPMIQGESINNKPLFMNNIKGLVAMQISPVELVTENIDKNKIKVTKLLSSSEQSWLMQDNINLNPMFLSPPEGKENEMKSYDLAYLLDGKFTSYFKGRNIPEKVTGEKDINKEEKTENKKEEQTIQGLAAEHTFLESSRPAKLFILPCSQMLQDNMLDPQGRSTNATFILNIIDHLNKEDAIAQLRSKHQTLNPIAQTTPFVKGVIKGFNIIVLPVLVILFGFIVLAKRTARKKKIANRFNV